MVLSPEERCNRKPKSSPLVPIVNTATVLFDLGCRGGAQALRMRRCSESMYSVKSGFGCSVVATRGSPFPVVLGSGFPLLGSPIGLVIVGDTTNLSPGAGPVLAAIGLGASPIECAFPFPVLFEEVSASVGLLWPSPVPTKLLVSTAGADGAPPALTTLGLLPLIQP